MLTGVGTYSSYTSPARLPDLQLPDPQPIGPSASSSSSSTLPTTALHPIVMSVDGRLARAITADLREEWEHHGLQEEVAAYAEERRDAIVRSLARRDGPEDDYGFFD